MVGQLVLVKKVDGQDPACKEIKRQIEGGSKMWGYICSRVTEDIFAIEIPGIKNKYSSYGVFYLSRDEIEVFEEEEKEMIGERKEPVCINVLNLWKERREEQINQEDKNNRNAFWRADDNMGLALEYLDTLKSLGVKIIVESDITKGMTDETKASLTTLDKSTQAKKDKLNQLYNEIFSMLLACAGRAENEMEVLVNYGIIDEPFGKMIDGGTHGQN